MVQHLVAQRPTYILRVVPTVSRVHSKTLGIPSLFQVEYKTLAQSWLGLSRSHLMSGKFFILIHPLKCRSSD